MKPFRERVNTSIVFRGHGSNNERIEMPVDEQTASGPVSISKSPIFRQKDFYSFSFPFNKFCNRRRVEKAQIIVINSAASSWPAESPGLVSGWLR